MSVLLGLWNPLSDGSAVEIGNLPDRPGDAVVRLDGRGLSLLRVGEAEMAGAHCDIRSVGPLRLAYDARIDNADALRRELGLDSTAPIGELLARAYLRWDSGCASRLIGDFVFVIHDPRRKRLFAARDHVGTRPLYYARPHNCFVFATAIPALLAVPGVARDPDESRIAQFLIDPTNPSPRHTFYRAIHKLPAAHWLGFDGTEPRLQRYWRPQRGTSPRGLSLPDAAAELHRRIVAAVDCRIQGTDAIGSHLSGGIDSALVTAIAARLQRERGRAAPIAYSWSPPAEEGATTIDRDERPMVQRMATHCQVPLRLCTQPDDLIESVLSQSLAVLNGQFFPAEHAVRALAANEGRKLLLSGWGGDEAASFNGRGYLPGLLIRGRWLRLSRILLARSRGHWKRLLADVWRHVLLPLRPSMLQRAERARLARAYAPTLVHADLIERTGGGYPLLDPPWQRAGVFACQRALFEYGHLTDRIEDWATQGEDAGLRYSYPLLDRRVLEWVYALPEHLYIDGSGSRLLFRHAAAAELPREMAWCRCKDDPSHHQHLTDLLLGWWRAAAVTAERRPLPEDWLDGPRVRDGLREAPDRVTTFPDRIRATSLAKALWLETLK